MCVQGGSYLSEQSQVVVNKLAQTAVIFYCTHPCAPTDEQLETWDAERILRVDNYQGDFNVIVFGWLDLVLIGPSARLVFPIRIGYFPNFTNFSGVKMGRKGDLGIATGSVHGFSLFASM
jgi:hypothetical protein